MTTVTNRGGHEDHRGHGAVSPPSDHATTPHHPPGRQNDLDLTPRHPPLHQTFFSSITHSAIIIESWNTAKVGGLVGGVVAGILLSLLLETAKLWNLSRRLSYLVSKYPPNRMPVALRLTTSGLHMLEVTTGYLLMLLVMSFNIFIVLAVVVGAGLGHFFVRPLVLRRANQRLRARWRQRRVFGAAAAWPRRQEPEAGGDHVTTTTEDPDVGVVRLEDPLPVGDDGDTDVFAAGNDRVVPPLPPPHALNGGALGGVDPVRERGGMRGRRWAVEDGAQEEEFAEDCHEAYPRMHCSQCATEDGQETRL